MNVTNVLHHCHFDALCHHFQKILMYASMYATERNSLVDVRSPLHRTVASHSGDRWKVAAGAGRQGRCAWRRITAEGR